MASTQDTVDLGELHAGDVVWLDADGNFLRVQRAPRQPCEVCVSRKVARQAVEDARQVDRYRPQLKALLLERERLKSERFTWFLYGVASGVVVGLGSAAALLLTR